MAAELFATKPKVQEDIGGNADTTGSGVEITVEKPNIATNAAATQEHLTQAIDTGDTEIDSSLLDENISATESRHTHNNTTVSKNSPQQTQTRGGSRGVRNTDNSKPQQHPPTIESNTAITQQAESNTPPALNELRELLEIGHIPQQEVPDVISRLERQTANLVTQLPSSQIQQVLATSLRNIQALTAKEGISTMPTTPKMVSAESKSVIHIPPFIYNLMAILGLIGGGVGLAYNTIFTAQTELPAVAHIPTTAIPTIERPTLEQSTLNLKSHEFKSNEVYIGIILLALIYLITQWVGSKRLRKLKISDVVADDTFSEVISTLNSEMAQLKQIVEDLLQAEYPEFAWETIATEQSGNRREQDIPFEPTTTFASVRSRGGSAKLQQLLNRAEQAKKDAASAKSSDNNGDGGGPNKPKGTGGSPEDFDENSLEHILQLLLGTAEFETTDINSANSQSIIRAYYNLTGIQKNFFRSKLSQALAKHKVRNFASIIDKATHEKFVDGTSNTIPETKITTCLRSLLKLKKKIKKTNDITTLRALEVYQALFNDIESKAVKTEEKKNTTREEIPDQPLYKPFSYFNQKRAICSDQVDFASICSRFGLTVEPAERNRVSALDDVSGTITEATKLTLQEWEITLLEHLIPQTDAYAALWTIPDVTTHITTLYGDKTIVNPFSDNLTYDSGSNAEFKIWTTLSELRRQDSWLPKQNNTTFQINAHVYTNKELINQATRIQRAVSNICILLLTAPDTLTEVTEIQGALIEAVISQDSSRQYNTSRPWKEQIIETLGSLDISQLQQLITYFNDKSIENTYILTRYSSSLLGYRNVKTTSTANLYKQAPSLGIVWKTAGRFTGAKISPNPKIINIIPPSFIQEKVRKKEGRNKGRSPRITPTTMFAKATSLQYETPTFALWDFFNIPVQAEAAESEIDDVDEEIITANARKQNEEFEAEGTVSVEVYYDFGRKQIVEGSIAEYIESVITDVSRWLRNDIETELVSQNQLHADIQNKEVIALITSYDRAVKEMVSCRIPRNYKIEDQINIVRNILIGIVASMRNALIRFCNQDQETNTIIFAKTQSYIRLLSFLKTLPGFSTALVELAPSLQDIFPSTSLLEVEQMLRIDNTKHSVAHFETPEFRTLTSEKYADSDRINPDELAHIVAFLLQAPHTVAEADTTPVETSTTEITCEDVLEAVTQQAQQLYTQLSGKLFLESVTTIVHSIRSAELYPLTQSGVKNKLDANLNRVQVLYGKIIAEQENTIKTPGIIFELIILTSWLLHVYEHIQNDQLFETYLAYQKKLGLLSVETKVMECVVCSSEINPKTREERKYIEPIHARKLFAALKKDISRFKFTPSKPPLYLQFTQLSKLIQTVNMHNTTEVKYEMLTVGGEVYKLAQRNAAKLILQPAAPIYEYTYYELLEAISTRQNHRPILIAKAIISLSKEITQSELEEEAQTNIMLWVYSHYISDGPEIVENNEFLQEVVRQYKEESEKDGIEERIQNGKEQFSVIYGHLKRELDGDRGDELEASQLFTKADIKLYDRGTVSKLRLIHFLSLQKNRNVYNIFSTIRSYALEDRRGIIGQNSIGFDQLEKVPQICQRVYRLLGLEFPTDHPTDFEDIHYFFNPKTVRYANRERIDDWKNGVNTYLHSYTRDVISYTAHKTMEMVLFHEALSDSSVPASKEAIKVYIRKVANTDPSCFTDEEIDGFVAFYQICVEKKSEITTKTVERPKIKTSEQRKEIQEGCKAMIQTIISDFKESNAYTNITQETELFRKLQRDHFSPNWYDYGLTDVIQTLESIQEIFSGEVEVHDIIKIKHIQAYAQIHNRWFVNGMLQNQPRMYAQQELEELNESNRLLSRALYIVYDFENEGVANTHLETIYKSYAEQKQPQKFNFLVSPLSSDSDTRNSNDTGSIFERGSVRRLNATRNTWHQSGDTKQSNKAQFAINRLTQLHNVVGTTAIHDYSTIEVRSFDISTAEQNDARTHVNTLLNIYRTDIEAWAVFLQQPETKIYISHLSGENLWFKGLTDVLYSKISEFPAQNIPQLSQTTFDSNIEHITIFLCIILLLNMVCSRWNSYTGDIIVPYFLDPLLLLIAREDVETSDILGVAKDILSIPQDEAESGERFLFHRIQYDIFEAAHNSERLHFISKCTERLPILQRFYNQAQESIDIAQAGSEEINTEHQAIITRYYTRDSEEFRSCVFLIACGNTLVEASGYTGANNAEMALVFLNSFIKDTSMSTTPTTVAEFKQWNLFYQYMEMLLRHFNRNERRLIVKGSIEPSYVNVADGDAIHLNACRVASTVCNITITKEDLAPKGHKINRDEMEGIVLFLSGMQSIGEEITKIADRLQELDDYIGTLPISALREVVTQNGGPQIEAQGKTDYLEHTLGLPESRLLDALYSFNSETLLSYIAETCSALEHRDERHSQLLRGAILTTLQEIKQGGVHRQPTLIYLTYTAWLTNKYINTLSMDHMNKKVPTFYNEIEKLYTLAILTYSDISRGTIWNTVFPEIRHILRGGNTRPALITNQIDKFTSGKDSLIPPILNIMQVFQSIHTQQESKIETARASAESENSKREGGIEKPQTYIKIYEMLTDKTFLRTLIRQIENIFNESDKNRSRLFTADVGPIYTSSRNWLENPPALGELLQALLITHHYTTEQYLPFNEESIPIDIVKLLAITAVLEIPSIPFASQNMLFNLAMGSIPIYTEESRHFTTSPQEMSILGYLKDRIVFPIQEAGERKSVVIYTNSMSVERKIRQLAGMKADGDTMEEFMNTSEVNLNTAKLRIQGIMNTIIAKHNKR